MANSNNFGILYIYTKVMELYLQTSDHIFHNLRSFEIKTQTIFTFLKKLRNYGKLKTYLSNMVVNSQCFNGFCFEGGMI